MLVSLRFACLCVWTHLFPEMLYRRVIGWQHPQVQYHYKRIFIFSSLQNRTFKQCFQVRLQKGNPAIGPLHVWKKHFFGGKMFSCEKGAPYYGSIKLFAEMGGSPEHLAVQLSCVWGGLDSVLAAFITTRTLEQRKDNLKKVSNLSRPLQATVMVSSHKLTQWMHAPHMCMKTNMALQNERLPRAWRIPAGLILSKSDVCLQTCQTNLAGFILR